MITPDKLTELLSMTEVHKELEESVLRDIARRIAKSDFTVTETAAYEIEMGQQAGLLFDEITEAVSKETAKSKDEVKQIFKEAGAEVLNYDEGVLEAAGIEPVKFKSLSPQMKSIYTAALNGTIREIVNLTRTTAALSETSFINACNIAHAKVASGIFTYQEAIREAIEQAAQYGTRVLYPSGATASLDVAVRRAVLSGVGKTASTITEMKANEFEVDLMELSAHAGARPEHAVWQGRIVSRSGRAGYLSLSDIGYGEVTGFRGANCSHDWFMFFEGASERAYTDEELEAMKNATVTYNGEEMPEYKAREKQRAGERKIRSLKRELVCLDEGIKTSDDPDVIFELKQAFEKKAVKLKSKEAELADFCNQTGLKRDRFREHMFCAETENGIKAWTKSVSSKAVAKGLPKVAKAPDTILQNKLDYDIIYKDEWKQGIIPSLCDVTDVCIIAGKGCSERLRDVPRLRATYKVKNGWQKKAGNVYGENYSYQIHWYENNGVQYEAKLVGFKETERK